MSFLAGLLGRMQGAMEKEKYFTLRRAIRRHIGELEKESKPITAMTASEKVLNSKMSRRALATRDITKIDVDRIANEEVMAYWKDHKRPLSFKEVG